MAKVSFKTKHKIIQKLAKIYRIKLVALGARGPSNRSDFIPDFQLKSAHRSSTFAAISHFPLRPPNRFKCGRFIRVSLPLSRPTRLCCGAAAAIPKEEKRNVKESCWTVYFQDIVI
uniref:(northern house mosquito) hypothetical protein n=1 Tax=Culex pipiens TaxID=7175 RepID=A0A8D8JQ26_CULPI